MTRHIGTALLSLSSQPHPRPNPMFVYHDIRLAGPTLTSGEGPYDALVIPALFL